MRAYEYEIALAAVDRDGNKVKKKDIAAILFLYSNFSRFIKCSYLCNGEFQSGWIISIMRTDSANYKKVCLSLLHSLNLVRISLIDGTDVDIMENES